MQTRLVANESHALPAGTRIGRYELIDVLGEGGFGVTYQARDPELHREVAIKEYLPAGFSMRQADGTVLARSTQTAATFLWGRERFVEEARTLARLEKAAGIVNVHDIISTNGTAYMVMEFVRGETLETRLKFEGRLHQPAIERLLYPLLDGLEKVHQAGFLHRDIKPANILIDETGLPTLIDFGASRAALQGRTQTLTAVYTPGYAAFEQFTSAKQGPWTDIYALGATLYHCITGDQPPNAADRMREDTMIPAAEAGREHYAPSLLAAIDGALRLREADRPQSIAEWRRMFSGIVTPQPRTPGNPTAAPKTKALPGSKRPRRLAWALAISLTLGIAGAGYYGWQLVQAAAQRAAAEAANEMQAWTRASAAGTEAGYKEYLTAHPDGTHAAEARQALAVLEQQRQAAASRAEEEAWISAKTGNSVPALRQYLEKYPGGRHAAEARALIEVIERRPSARDCSSCPEMVRIPTGSFAMGSPAHELGRYDSEGPTHRVTVRAAFSLGKYEVTREEFAAFVQDTGYRTAGEWRNPGFAQTQRHPVVNVSWDDAKAYVQWLSRLTGKKYRLPSEAEWEYAARAGTTTARYWGEGHDDACRYANVDDQTHKCTDGQAKTAPVGSYKANAFGLHDILGNAWEWTEDCWNTTYAGAPIDGSAWLSGDCGRRMARGGSWSDGPWNVRAGYRVRLATNDAGTYVGFRVARTD